MMKVSKCILHFIGCQNKIANLFESFVIVKPRFYVFEQKKNTLLEEKRGFDV